MQENQNTIGKAVKRIFDQATVKANRGNVSSIVACDWFGPESNECKDAIQREGGIEAQNQKRFLTAQSGEKQQPVVEMNGDAMVMPEGGLKMAPGAKMAQRTSQYLISALGNFNDEKQKFVPITSQPNIIPDTELSQMGIDVNKIRESASILASKMKQVDQERSTSLEKIADYNQRKTIEMEIMIKYISDPAVVKAVEDLANQFINLNIVKLYENQPYFNDFCKGMKPSEQQLQQIKQSLTLAEAVVSGYGKTIQDLLTNFVDKIESIMTRCNTLDPELIARMRRLYINIKGIMVTKHLNTSELAALCKPDLESKISQQIALCKASTDALLKKKEDENTALHKRHMMFISLLVLLLIFVIVYFTVLKK